MSADGLRIDLRDGILILTLANPPANELTPGLRTALLNAVAGQGATCRGIVLAAEGAHFAGHLPTEPDLGTPDLSELCRVVADSPVPVVAVLQGVVTGPGAELALAARARLANPGLRIGFADVTLGLCPQGGSTQRLPRLIGAKAALRLLLSGKAIASSDALGLGLIDGITEANSIAAAARLAGALAVGELLERPEPEAIAWQKAVAEARQDPTVRMPAGRRIIDCVEAALLLPPENAQAYETVARRDLQESAEAIGLGAAARAERRALALPPVLAQLRPLSVDRIGILGVAPDLARLAVAALSRDLAVAWVFPDAAARHAGLATVDTSIDDGVRAGTLTPERARMMRGKVTAGEDPMALAAMPLLISDHEFSGIDGSGRLPGAAQLALHGSEGEMSLALAPAGRVCELTLPADTLPLARATALAGLRKMGLAPVLVGSRPVVGARMADAGRTAIAWMVARGVPRRQIAAALDTFGARLPDPVSVEAPSILRAMPVVEVLNRWLAALANEGARLLDEGLARRPSDIDYLMVAGYHFPRWRGGPMHQAAQRGVMVLRNDLRLWGAEAALWSPAPLIDRLIRDGRGFADLNG